MTVPPPHRGQHSRRRRGSIRSGRGTIRETAFGTYLAYLRVARQTRRRCFDSFAAAERWIEQQERGGELPALTSGQYADAQTALHLLPAGVSLVDAARDFVRAHGVAGSARPIRLSEAVAGFLGERAVSLTDRSLTSYRQTFARLAAALDGDPLLSSVGAEQLEPFVASPSGSTRNTRIARISPLFAWAERKGFVAANPCARLARARKVEAPVGVFTPDEVGRVMAAAVRLAPACVPYLAVGFFTGIRPAELRRLTPECFGPLFVRLDGRVTKAARARTVTIRPNLAAWLQAFPWRRPPIRAKTIVPNDVCGAAGVAWKPDVMRHSYATYAYELCHDAAAVAAEMGHQGTAVFFKHYRALAEPGDGKRYFAITPRVRV